jgi:hypothetical protein
MNNVEKAIALLIKESYNKKNGTEIHMLLAIVLRLFNK